MLGVDELVYTKAISCLLNLPLIAVLIHISANAMCRNSCKVVHSRKMSQGFAHSCSSSQYLFVSLEPPGTACWLLKACSTLKAQPAIHVTSATLSVFRSCSMICIMMCSVGNTSGGTRLAPGHGQPHSCLWRQAPWRWRWQPIWWPGLQAGQWRRPL